jgi:hypothetical protein
MLDKAIESAKRIGYSRIVLDSHCLHAVSTLYLKNVLQTFLATITTTELIYLWEKTL